MEKSDSVLLADLHDVVSDCRIPWDMFHGACVLITGATGVIGSALVRALSVANENYSLNMRLLAHGRSKEKGIALTREWGAEFIDGDVRSPPTFDCITDRVDYIFHCAAITKSSDMVSRPADVVSTSVDGTRNILDLAVRSRCKGLVYLSSMEVYGQTVLREVTENDLGDLDLSVSRSSYPKSKRLCETMCAEYARQYGVPARIARLAQTFGAGTPIEDTRVFAQFARNVAAGRDIELHTEGKSRGNYCSMPDTVRGLLFILLRGRDGEVYNVADPSASRTIREMAELVAEQAGGNVKVVVNVPEDIKKRGYAPDVGYTLNADKLKALGWAPQYGLEHMYGTMLACWREQGDVHG